MNRINPTGLKGQEITDRMKELMGIVPQADNKRTSVVHLSKLGPDNKVYGIVRENHEYYIKTAVNKPNLVMEDFAYLGGLKNKKDWAYPSYEKATKHLNLKFISLCESLGVTNTFNTLKNDLLVEDANFMKDPVKNNMFQESAKMSECCGAAINEGKCSECGSVIKEETVTEVEDNDGKDVPTNGTGEDEDTLNELEQAVEDMTEQKKNIQKTLLPKKRLTIEASMNEMDGIIDNLGKKKVQAKK